MRGVILVAVINYFFKYVKEILKIQLGVEHPVLVWFGQGKVFSLVGLGIFPLPNNELHMMLVTPSI
jgi:hypothetical protein